MKKSASSKQWLRRHVNDPYVQRSKKEGFRARSAYKLIEIDDKDRILKAGTLIVDLGAAPGGWSQVAAKKLGPGGRVVAIDLLEMAPIPGVAIIRGDFAVASGLESVATALNGTPPDGVLSDLAPNMSGISISDQARSMELAELARDFALQHLRGGGWFLVKVFQGEGYDDFLRSLKAAFNKVVVRKPDASRDESAELYILARDPRVD
jgi:23S rRNA (uridine2552-2'-O)-methyltransferase